MKVQVLCSRHIIVDVPESSTEAVETAVLAIDPELEIIEWEVAAGEQTVNCENCEVEMDVDLDTVGLCAACTTLMEEELKADEGKESEDATPRCAEGHALNADGECPVELEQERLEFERLREEARVADGDDAMGEGA